MLSKESAVNLPPAVQLMLKTSLRARRGSLLSAKAHHHRPCPASGHSLVAYSRQLLFSTRKDLPCSRRSCTRLARKVGVMGILPMVLCSSATPTSPTYSAAFTQLVSPESDCLVAIRLYSATYSVKIARLSCLAEVHLSDRVGPSLRYCDLVVPELTFRKSFCTAVDGHQLVGGPRQAH